MDLKDQVQEAAKKTGALKIIRIGHILRVSSATIIIAAATIKGWSSLIASDSAVLASLLVAVCASFLTGVIRASIGVQQYIGMIQGAMRGILGTAHAGTIQDHLKDGSVVMVRDNDGSESPAELSEEELQKIVQGLDGMRAEVVATLQEMQESDYKPSGMSLLVKLGLLSPRIHWATQLPVLSVEE